MCRPSASSVTTEGVDIIRQRLQAVGLVAAQVSYAGKGRGGVCQGAQRSDGRGELANITHIALNTLQRSVFGALCSDKSRLLGDHNAHIHQDMANSVARLRGIGGPALNGHAAAGDSSGGKERRGIGQIRLDVPLSAGDRARVHGPRILAGVYAHACLAQHAHGHFHVRQRGQGAALMG